MTSSVVSVLVLSDTHLGAALDRLPEAVWKLAGRADAILHAGDVTGPQLLDALAERATLHAVLGNNDVGLEDRLPEVVETELGGVRIAMVHDSGPTAGRHGRLARRFPDADVVVFGHSHRPLVEQVVDGPLLVNPGSPTQRRREPVHTVAWLELGGGSVRRADIIEVGPLAPVTG